jgi:uncharacterized membrane protein
MADATERAVTATFDSAAQAEQAAQELLQWDKDSDLMKLGAVGVLTTNARGELETKNLSARNTGKGAMVGLGLGALAAVLSGGLTLIPTALGGAVGGGLVGSRSRQGLGMSDEDLQQLRAALGGGRAAVLVICEGHDVDTATALLTASGGTVRRAAAAVSAKTLQEASQAAAAAAAAGAPAGPESPEPPAAPAPSPTDAPGSPGSSR